MPKRQLKAKIKRSAPKPAAKTPAPIGIIGGSGLYNMPGLEDARERRVRTPFGDPSDAFVVGRLEGRPSHFSRATAEAIASLRRKSTTAPIFTR